MHLCCAANSWSTMNRKFFPDVFLKDPLQKRRRSDLVGISSSFGERILDPMSDRRPRPVSRNYRDAQQWNGSVKTRWSEHLPNGDDVNSCFWQLSVVRKFSALYSRELFCRTRVNSNEFVFCCHKHLSPESTAISFESNPRDEKECKSAE